MANGSPNYPQENYNNPVSFSGQGGVGGQNSGNPNIQVELSSVNYQAVITALGNAEKINPLGNPWPSIAGGTLGTAGAIGLGKYLGAAAGTASVGASLAAAGAAALPVLAVYYALTVANRYNAAREHNSTVRKAMRETARWWEETSREWRQDFQINEAQNEVSFAAAGISTQEGTGKAIQDARRRQFNQRYADAERQKNRRLKELEDTLEDTSASSNLLISHRSDIGKTLNWFFNSGDGWTYADQYNYWENSWKEFWDANNVNIDIRDIPSDPFNIGSTTRTAAQKAQEAVEHFINQIGSGEDIGDRIGDFSGGIKL